MTGSLKKSFQEKSGRGGHKAEEGGDIVFVAGEIYALRRLDHLSNACALLVKFSDVFCIFVYVPVFLYLCVCIFVHICVFAPQPSV